LPDGKGGLIYSFPADCGKCLKCLIKRKAQWSFRITEEQRVSFSSYFVTLTYDEKHVPHGNGTLTISKADHFDFIKKLKEYESPKALSLREQVSLEEFERKKRGIKEFGKLKYYGVYEYGDQFLRPHGHYILFNVRDINNIALSWGKGKIDIDHDVNVNNIDYVLKYMVKDHSNIDYENRQKECSFMSKAIGLPAADEAFICHISKTDKNQVINSRGRKIPIPRYYRKKFLSDEERLRKNQYIAEQIEKKKLSEERAADKRGINLYKYDAQRRDVRQHMLKSRPKRMVE